MRGTLRHLTLGLISLSVLAVCLAEEPEPLPPARGLVLQGDASKGGVENPVSTFSESHGLIIGVSDYRYWPKLPGVKQDVEEVKAVLELEGFQVEVISDPDHDQLNRAFEAFIDRWGLDPGARLLVYFAGHGTMLPQLYAPAVKVGYILPTDAPRSAGDGTLLQAKAFSLDGILSLATRIQARHALFVFDACFAGTLFTGTRGDEAPSHILDKVRRPVREFITAGDEKERVSDDSMFRKMFVRALTEGTADADRDGYVTGVELGEYLARVVPDLTNGMQHPRYAKIKDPNLDRGDFVFRLPGSAAPPAGSKTAALPPPGTRLDLLTDEAERLEQLEQIARIDLKNMGADLEKRRGLDGSALPPARKIELWSDFLNTWGRDIPFSEEDEAMRREAMARRTRWIQESGQIELEVVELPGGSFTMGSEDGSAAVQPPRTVTVAGFRIARTEIANALYAACVGKGACTAPHYEDGSCFVEEGGDWKQGKVPQPFQRPDVPVSCVTRDQARRFAAWAGGRLPSEAEWEYAARGRGTGRRYPWRSGRASCERAVMEDGGPGCGTNAPFPVCSKPEGDTPEGLCDMAGNVWEWVADCWHDGYDAAPIDGSAWFAECPRAIGVIRGGSWVSGANALRGFDRAPNPPDRPVAEVGFRVVRP
jgi:formylglycine-generating enzyme required for sulfatase activity